MYGEEKAPSSQNETDAVKKRKLSSSITLLEEKKGRTATCSAGGQADEVRGVETEKTIVEAGEEELILVSKKAETENTKELGTEELREVGIEEKEEKDTEENEEMETEHGEEKEREVNEEVLPTGFPRAPALQSLRREQR